MSKQPLTGAENLKILCPHCGSELKIRSSEQVIDSVRKIYCNCDNEKCLARPVMQLSHSHDTQKPINTTDSIDLLAAALGQWPVDKRRDFLKRFSD